MRIIKIHELARERDRVRARLEANEDVLKEHLLKLFYYRTDVENVPGWIREVRAYLGRVNKIKSTKKYPDESFIFETLWSEGADSFDDEHKGYLEDFVYDGLPEVVYSSKARDFCKDYIKWASGELSKKGYVSLPEVHSEIESLWDRYSYT